MLPRSLQLADALTGDVTRDGRPFVGRRAELDLALRQLAARRRLITLTGPPGVGKTMLARRLLHDWLQRPARPKGAAWFVDLSDVHDLEGIAAQAATLLGLPATPGRDVEEALERVSRSFAACSGPILLVLDNCEQLVAHSATTVQRWLRDADNVQIVVTSRHRLELPEETLLEVVPLGLPPADCTAIEALEASDAGKLFLIRARALRSGWSPADNEVATLVRILHRLDGLPLAIELAATRLLVMSPAELQRRLSDRFATLSRGGRRASRHAALETAIASSWELLNGWERSALAQASVFRGGFDLSAAAAVVEVSALGAPDVLEVIQNLREKSLLAEAPGPEAGRLRFRLLESIRDYAILRAAELFDGDALERRHASFYAAAGLERAQRAEDRGDAEALDWLSGERRNLRAAFDWVARYAAAAADGNGLLRSQLALALDAVLRRGPAEPRVEVLERALAEPIDLLDPLRARVHRCRADAFANRRPMSDARDALETALEQARRSDDAVTETWAMGLLANALRADGDATGCLEILEQGLARAEASGLPTAKGLAYRALAWHHSRADGTADAAHLYEQALQCAREAGNASEEASVRRAYAVLLRDRGRPAEASRHLEKARELATRLKDWDQLADLLASLATTYLNARRYPDAEAAIETAVQVAGRTGNRIGLGYALGARAMLALDRGDVDAGLRAAVEAEQVLEGVDPIQHPLSIRLRAQILWLAGRPDEAVPLLERSSDASGQHASRLDVVFGHLILAVARAAVGQARQARLDLERYRTLAAELGPSVFDPVVPLYLAYAERAGAGPPDESSPSEARAALRAMLSPGPPTGRTSGASPSPVRSVAAVRTAARLLASMLDPWEQACALAEARDHDGAALLVVRTLGFVRRPAADWVDLSHRPQLVALLERLVTQRVEARPGPITPAEVAETLWPGERVLPQALANRIYKAIHDLRRAALGPVLQNTPEGYLLDPSVRLVAVAPGDLCEELGWIPPRATGRRSPRSD